MNKMKKTIIGILIALLTVSLSFGEIQLKFSGGVNWISGSDFNAFARAQNALYALWYTNIQGSRTEFGPAPLFQAEAVSYFSPSLGVGLGAGILRMSVDDRMEYLESNSPGNAQFRSQLTIIPVTLNLHYRSRMSPRLALDGYAGFGIYLSRLDVFESQFWQAGPDLYTSDFKGDVRGTFGLQAGVGLEYELSSRLAVFISGGLRVASYGPINGRATTSYETPFGSQNNTNIAVDYYYFDYFSYPYMIFGQTDPRFNNNDIKNLRKAAINLSGAAFTTGIRIKI